MAQRISVGANLNGDTWISILNELKCFCNVQFVQFRLNADSMRASQQRIICTISVSVSVSVWSAVSVLFICKNPNPISNLLTITKTMIVGRS